MKGKIYPQEGIDLHRVGFAGGVGGGSTPPPRVVEPPTSLPKKEVGGSGFDPPTCFFEARCELK